MKAKLLSQKGLKARIQGSLVQLPYRIKDLITDHGYRIGSCILCLLKKFKKIFLSFKVKVKILEKSIFRK